MPIVFAVAGLAVATLASAAAPQNAPAGEAAAGQHAAIGVKTTRANFRRTEHPDAQWFPEAGLGLFVHWGISSVHGGIDLSWGMIAEKPWQPNEQPGVSLVTPAEYFALAERFKPDRYDPDRWLRAAREAGCRYAVLTTRHHDGFALWPSDQGEFGVKQHLPGVDLVGRYVEACRRSGLKVGLYYSPPDWHYNRRYMSFHYGVGDARFPGRKPFGLKHETLEAVPPKPAGWDDAYKAYIRAQVTELLTRYGKVDLLWFDGGPEAFSFDEIRALQPGIVVNPRMHGYGDFKTAECKMPEGPFEGWWELCDIWPMGGWGYSRGHERYKSAGWMLSQLTKARGWGGNYLINVGPRPNGELPSACYERLAEVAAWMKHSGESLFGVAPGPHPARCNVPLTIEGDTWYLHLPPGFKETVTVTEATPPRAVTLLRTGQALPAAVREGTLRLDVPADLRTELVDVVAVRW